MLTPPPHKPKELAKLVDTSSQVSTLDDGGGISGVSPYHHLSHSHDY